MRGATELQTEVKLAGIILLLLSAYRSSQDDIVNHAHICSH